MRLGSYTSLLTEKSAENRKRYWGERGEPTTSQSVQVRRESLGVWTDSTGPSLDLPGGKGQVLASLVKCGGEEEGALPGKSAPPYHPRLPLIWRERVAVIYVGSWWESSGLLPVFRTSCSNTASPICLHISFFQASTTEMSYCNHRPTKAKILTIWPFTEILLTSVLSAGIPFPWESLKEAFICGIWNLSLICVGRKNHRSQSCTARSSEAEAAGSAIQTVPTGESALWSSDGLFLRCLSSLGWSGRQWPGLPSHIL